MLEVPGRWLVLIEFPGKLLVLGWPHQHASWIMRCGGIFDTERGFKMVALVVPKNKVGRHSLPRVVDYHRRALGEKQELAACL